MVFGRDGKRVKIRYIGKDVLKVVSILVKLVGLF